MLVHHRVPCMKQLGVLLFPPGGEASPSQGYRQISVENIKFLNNYANSTQPVSHLPVSQSVSQPASQSVSQSVSDLTNQSFREAASQLVHQPDSQSDSQSVRQSVSQEISKKQISSPASWSTNIPVFHLLTTESVHDWCSDGLLSCDE